ncbi:hypothetical protein RAM80_07565 [Pseudomonas sp. App30]|uniref:hypothetical protein n=1 Tax=Pseudomonas sp. App30 TaxID=3068990 RepID=UPI003A801083
MTGIADSTAFKVIVPVFQMILSAGAIGAFTFVFGAIGAFQAQMAKRDTDYAVLREQVETLKSRADANDKIVDVVRVSTQRNEYQVSAIMESIRNGVLSGRPK